MAERGRCAAAGARTLFVGVTGHRPRGIAGSDPDLLLAQTRGILAQVAAASRPRPGIVASLAEGADRLVVTEALALGFTLTAVLPFARDEFARDFAAESS